MTILCILFTIIDFLDLLATLDTHSSLILIILLANAGFTGKTLDVALILLVGIVVYQLMIIDHLDIPLEHGVPQG